MLAPTLAVDWEMTLILNDNKCKKEWLKLRVGYIFNNVGYA